MGRAGRRAVIMAVAVGVLLVAWAVPLQAQATGSLEASNQPLQNNSITVAKASMSQAGWVVAAVDEGGQPGAIIGQTALKAGETASNVTIKLSQAVPTGGKLWLRLHVDAGKAGTFEFPGADGPLLVSGKPVTQQIMISAASATSSNPPALPNTGGDTASMWLLLLLAGGIFVVGSFLRARNV